MKYKMYIQNYQYSVNKDSPRFWWAIPAAMAVGSAISAISSDSANEQNVAAQKEINKQNIQNQWRMFGAQNARQDFLNANQALIHRQSLQKAGININADFGGFPNVSTNATPSAEAKAPIVNPVFPSDLGGQMANMVQQAQLTQANVENINADTKLKESQATNTEMDTLLKETERWNIQELTPAQKANVEKQTELFKSEISKNRVSVRFIQKQIEKVQSEIANIDVETSWLLDSYDNRLASVAQQIATMQSQQALNIAQSAVAYKSLQVMDKQMRLIESQISLNQEQWMVLNQECQNLAIDGNFKQFELNIKKKFGEKEAQLILEQINEQILNIRSNMMWRPVIATLGAVGTGIGALKMLE